MDSAAPLHRRPLWLGALLAPLAAPFALLVLVFAFDAIEGRLMHLDAAIEIFAFAFALGLPIAVAGMWLLGLPCAVWLRRRGALSIGRLCLVAAPLGALALVLGMYAIGGRIALPAMIGIGAAVAVAMALAFGLVCGVAWRR
jgi:hypothetical protein